MFLPVVVWTPGWYGDDGGYMHMLNYFMGTGKVDLMHWSQPAAFGVLIIASLVAKIIGGGFLQFDFIGLLFTTCACCGAYTLARHHVEPRLSFLIAISIFCFNEVVLVAPTFMTDMPFLAYTIWWLVFTQEIVAKPKIQLWKYFAWSSFLVLALMTRSTILLAMPGFLVSLLFCPVQRKRLLVLTALFTVTVIVGAAITHSVSINQMSLLDVTSLRQIFVSHDFAMFDIRAAVVAGLSVMFAGSPLLMGVKQTNKELRPVQICTALVALGLSLYFSMKGHFQPLNPLLTPLVVCCVGVAAFNLPLFVAAAIGKNRTLSVILISCITLQFAVMPIMAHPLTRHAIPVMVMLTTLIAIANLSTLRAQRISFLLALALILNNLVGLQSVRLINFAERELGLGLIQEGIKPQDIDAGWGWFCYYGLTPGRQDGLSYQERYEKWQRDAKFFIGPAQGVEKPDLLVARLPVNYLSDKCNLCVIQRRSVH